MRSIVLIAHDIRSTHNIGALMRTAEGLGVKHLYLSGYSPYPGIKNDKRLPHLVRKLSNQIHKTALGAEDSLSWSHADNIEVLIEDLKDKDYEIVALEQAPNSTALDKYEPPRKVAILLGREVEGIDKQLIKLCDEVVEIPMKGKKESFNVTTAAAIALYHCLSY